MPDGRSMSRTSILSQQHRVIIAAIAQLLAMIGEGGRDSLAISLAIGRLTGQLRLHFRQEDVFLYPELLESADEDLAEAARAFQAEVGELCQHYECFLARWPSHHVIRADFAQFRKEALAIFGAIDDRCRREDRQLFPMVDVSYAGTARLSA